MLFKFGPTGKVEQQSLVEVFNITSAPQRKFLFIPLGSQHLHLGVIGRDHKLPRSEGFSMERMMDYIQDQMAKPDNAAGIVDLTDNVRRNFRAIHNEILQRRTKAAAVVAEIPAALAA